MTGIAAPAPAQRGAGLLVVGLDRDDQVEFLTRIVEPFNRRQQSLDRARFAVERGDHGIDRQGIVRQVVGALVPVPIDEGSGQPQPKPCQERRRQHNLDGIERRRRRHGEGDKRHQPGDGDRHDMAEPPRRGGRQCRPAPLEFTGRARGQRPAGVAQYVAGEAFGTGEAEPARQVRIAFDDAADPPRRAGAGSDHQTKLIVDHHRQQPGGGGFDQPLVSDRTQRAGNVVERFEGHTEVLAQGAQIGLLAERAGGDQDAVGADGKGGGTVLGGGERAGGDQRSADSRFPENGGLRRRRRMQAPMDRSRGYRRFRQRKPPSGATRLRRARQTPYPHLCPHVSADSSVATTYSRV